MLNKEKLIKACPDIIYGFLDDKWDKSIMGFVERQEGDKHVFRPAYGFQALKSMSKTDNGVKLSPSKAYKNLSKLINNDTHQALIITAYDRRQLWDIIEMNDMRIWENLNRAVIGLSSIPSASKRCVVYNKILSAQILQDMQVGQAASDVKNYIDTLEYIDANILGIHLGESTPWFLTPVNQLPE
ncbi:MAG: hypothetical protein RR382_00045 [Tannerellaceae bacterium]